MTRYGTCSGLHVIVSREPGAGSREPGAGTASAAGAAFLADTFCGARLTPWAASSAPGGSARPA